MNTVVKKFGECTGQELFTVRGGNGIWSSTPAEAISVHNRCQVFWERYFNERNNSNENDHGKKRK